MSMDQRDIEWRCGCGHTNPDFDERCNGCGQERYPRRIEVLVAYPPFGSLWLSKAEWHGDYVEGETWDDSGVGYNMPDDYHGEPAWMNFPLSSVLKVRLER